MKLAIEGTCLCKSVQVGVTRRPAQVTQCNCTTCRSYGALWAYYRRSAVSIVAPRGGLDEFSPRPNGLKFARCRTCGAVIYWDRRSKDAHRRMGINTRLFDQARMARVPIKVLDGDVTWRVLGTYVKPELWISPTRQPAATKPSRPTPAKAKAKTKAKTAKAHASPNS